MSEERDLSGNYEKDDDTQSPEVSSVAISRHNCLELETTDLPV